jgi:hypothetical protein
MHQAILGTPGMFRIAEISARYTRNRDGNRRQQPIIFVGTGFFSASVIFNASKGQNALIIVRGGGARGS